MLILSFRSLLSPKPDIYVMAISHEHMVAPTGKYIAIVSTTVETNNPQREIQPGLALLGPIIEAYVALSVVCLLVRA